MGGPHHTKIKTKHPVRQSSLSPSDDDITATSSHPPLASTAVSTPVISDGQGSSAPLSAPLAPSVPSIAEPTEENPVLVDFPNRDPLLHNRYAAMIRDGVAVPKTAVPNPE